MEHFQPLAGVDLHEFRQRFEEHASRLVIEGDCLIWTGAAHERGYGRLRWRGKIVSVHRLAWELWTGEPPPDHHLIAQRCKRPACCNPAHLRLTDPLDNARSRDALTCRTAPRNQGEAGQVLEQLNLVIARRAKSLARLIARRAAIQRQLPHLA